GESRRGLIGFALGRLAPFLFQLLLAFLGALRGFFSGLRASLGLGLGRGRLLRRRRFRGSSGFGRRGFLGGLAFGCLELGRLGIFLNIIAFLDKSTPVDYLQFAGFVAHEASFVWTK